MRSVTLPGELGIEGGRPCRLLVNYFPYSLNSLAVDIVFKLMQPGPQAAAVNLNTGTEGQGEVGQVGKKPLSAFPPDFHVALKEFDKDKSGSVDVNEVRLGYRREA